MTLKFRKNLEQQTVHAWLIEPVPTTACGLGIPGDWPELETFDPKQLCGTCRNVVKSRKTELGVKLKDLGKGDE